MATRFRLLEILRERRLSQREVARLSGLSLTIVSRIATNKARQVALATLDQLAGALEVEPGALLARYDETSPPESDRLEHLILEFDGHRVDARLQRYPTPGRSARSPRRQPRWMLSIDGRAPVNGPLTWDVGLDRAAESDAIVEFVRERKRIEEEYGEANRALRKKMRENGPIAVLAAELGVSPAALAASIDVTGRASLRPRRRQES